MSTPEITVHKRGLDYLGFFASTTLTDIESFMALTLPLSKEDKVRVMNLKLGGEMVRKLAGIEGIKRIFLDSQTHLFIHLDEKRTLDEKLDQREGILNQVLEAIKTRFGAARHKVEVKVREFPIIEPEAPWWAED